MGDGFYQRTKAALPHRRYVRRQKVEELHAAQRDRRQLGRDAELQRLIASRVEGDFHRQEHGDLYDGGAVVQWVAMLLICDIQ